MEILLLIFLGLTAFFFFARDKDPEDTSGDPSVGSDTHGNQSVTVVSSASRSNRVRLIQGAVGFIEALTDAAGLAIGAMAAIAVGTVVVGTAVAAHLIRAGIAEADLFAWLGTREFARRAADPATVLGECKSYASNAFSEEDIGRLKTLCEWFPGAYVVAACLKESLSADEVRRLRDLAEWGWSRDTVVGKPSRLIVLTGTELFAQNVQEGWQNSGGVLADLAQRGFASSLGRLPFGTQEAHLGFSEPEIEKMARGDATEP